MIEMWVYAVEVTPEGARLWRRKAYLSGTCVRLDVETAPTVVSGPSADPVDPKDLSLWGTDWPTLEASDDRVAFCSTVAVERFCAAQARRLRRLRRDAQHAQHAQQAARTLAQGLHDEARTAHQRLCGYHDTRGILPYVAPPEGHPWADLLPAQCAPSQAPLMCPRCQGSCVDPVGGRCTLCTGAGKTIRRKERDNG